MRHEKNDFNQYYAIAFDFGPEIVILKYGSIFNASDVKSNLDTKSIYTKKILKASLNVYTVY